MNDVALVSSPVRERKERVEGRRKGGREGEREGRREGGRGRREGGRGGKEGEEGRSGSRRKGSYFISTRHFFVTVTSRNS